MRLVLLAVACLAVAAATGLHAAIDLDTGLDAAVPDVKGRFIVRFKSHAAKQRVSEFLTSFQAMESTDSSAFDHEYSTVYPGFAGKMSDAFRRALQAQHGADIAYIVPDGVVRALGRQDNPPAWGLTRVSQRQLKLPGPYMYPDSAGAGVDVWVVDTGLFAAHAEFGGRATLVKSFVDGETTPDGNGHGSHCSGTIGSHTYGIAKKVTLKGVKVLNSGGSGTWSAVISGVDFVAKNVRKGKTVMSMSLGGGKNQALNDAMNNAVKAGVVAIVAAGNNAGDACQISPASAEHAFAVGATDNADNMASFSNRGKCVKIFAPGVNVMSVWNTAGSTKTISGTSMATPHVAGVAALIMSQKMHNTPQEVYNELIALGSKGFVKGLPADGSPNLMLYNGAGGRVVEVAMGAQVAVAA